MASLEFDAVSKVFNAGKWAVKDLNLTVNDGEFMVFVGPSGCGKTTALRMLAGFEPITAGDIRIGGERVNEVAPRARDIAMVFQNYALYPHMNVADNIAYGLKVRRVPKRERAARVRRAAEMLALTDELKRKPSELSGGQRQRVAMGRAIVREPRAFLMDEPLSNLDARLRVRMRTEIAKLQRELGVTTVYVTHDQVEAMTMADRVAVMRGGQLQQLDTPQSIYAEPKNLFVATFIGSPAMNVLEGRLINRAGRLQCEIGPTTIVLPDALLGDIARPGEGGRTLAVGVRPDALSATSGETSGLQGTVVVSEDLGDEVMCHLDVPVRGIEHEAIMDGLADEATSISVGAPGAARAQTSSVVARLPAGTRLDRGDRVALRIDPRQLHFFDLEDGSALPRASARTSAAGAARIQAPPMSGVA